MGQKIKNALERFKQKQGIAQTRDLFIIATVFSLSGASITLTVRPLYNYAFQHIAHVPFPLKALAYVLFAVPVYQCFLLVYGFLFGQYKYFWERQKKMGRRIQKSFLKLKDSILPPDKTQNSEYV